MLELINSATWDKHPKHQLLIIVRTEEAVVVIPGDPRLFDCRAAAQDQDAAVPRLPCGEMDTGNHAVKAICAAHQL